MGTIRFRNDHFAAITGYIDYVQGNLTICHVYYVKGLRHSLFLVGQFYDGDLEVAFRSNTCYVYNLEGDDLLTKSRDSNLYTISISEMATSSPVCLMSKASSTKSWLWHCRLYDLNFDYLGKMKLKSDIRIFIGYSESSRGFHIYNRRTRKIMKTIYVKFDELTTMASECNNLEPGLNRSNFQDSSDQSTQTSSKEDLDALFDTPSSLTTIIDENEAPKIVSTSEEPTSPITNNLADESIQEDTANLDGNTFINPLCSPVLDEAKSSSTNQDPLNMHEFYQLHHSTDKYIKNHPLEQVIGDPSKPVMTQSSLNTDTEMCMYALTVSTTEPKNIKEAMLDHSWPESMQDELHHFKRDYGLIPVANLLQEMDNPDITMEEHVQYETEKALRNNQVYNWEIAKYGEISWCLERY
ncbi:retrovirus-related pol polyprotein from transposon TNT 1-94 [Tanacetum coccineum]